MVVGSKFLYKYHKEPSTRQEESLTLPTRFSEPRTKHLIQTHTPSCVMMHQPKSGSPLLMLSLDDEEGGYRVYNPHENKIYEIKTNFTGYRFLASSGKWFLVMDPQSFLYIINIFTDEKIHLPPLESLRDGLIKLERVGDHQFSDRLIRDMSSLCIFSAQDLRGVLWVDKDDKNRDYVVVWQFDGHEYLGYCKRGDDHYQEITTRIGVPRELQGLHHMVLQCYNLYVLTTRRYIRQLDLSGRCFKDVSVHRLSPMMIPIMIRDEAEKFIGKKVLSHNDNIVVTTLGEVLIVFTRAYESTSGEIHRFFRIYKRDPKDPDPVEPMLNEVSSCTLCDDEALFLDLGTNVHANHTLGIEPNSIYFTRDDRLYHRKLSCLDICIYDFATKTIKRFPCLDTFKIKDAQWFIPS